MVSAETRQSGGANQPKLLLALECDRPLAASSQHSLENVEEVIIGRGSRRHAVRTLEAGVHRLRLRVPDRRMSSTHAKLSRVQGGWVLEDAGSKNGTRCNGVPHRRMVLSDGDLIELGHTLFWFRCDCSPPDLLDRDASDLRPPTPELATFDPVLAAAMDALPEAARSSIPILLVGESGAGQELVAAAIHRLSGRTGALTAVHCGAIPKTLREAALRGYKKAAFPGAAQDRVGLIRSADGGTLFLDEIAELEAPAQAALRRVLDRGEVLPVGAAQPIAVDVRLVAGTAGRLENDLRARMAGFTVQVPPLHERREDLGLLIATLLRQQAGFHADAISFSTEAARALFRHDWPQQVRELEKCISVAIVMANRGQIRSEHLPEAVSAAVASPGRRPALASGVVRADTLSEEDLLHRNRLVALLREHDGSLTAVGRTLAKSRVQIDHWLRRYGIEPASFRPL